MTLSTTDIFQEHAGQIYRWALRVVGRHEDALDVVQDVYVRWSLQCARESPAHTRAWLRTVTLNRAMDHQRRGRCSVRVAEEALAGAAAGPSTTTSPSQRLEREDFRRQVISAMEALSDMQRAVLVAKVYDDMTFTQIAVELDLAVPTIKTHYLRAIQSLRDRLEKEE